MAPSKNKSKKYSKSQLFQEASVCLEGAINEVDRAIEDINLDSLKWNCERSVKILSELERKEDDPTIQEGLEAFCRCFADHCAVLEELSEHHGHQKSKSPVRKKRPPTSSPTSPASMRSPIPPDVLADLRRSIQTIGLSLGPTSTTQPFRPPASCRSLDFSQCRPAPTPPTGTRSARRPLTELPFLVHDAPPTGGRGRGKDAAPLRLTLARDVVGLHEVCRALTNVVVMPCLHPEVTPPGQDSVTRVLLLGPPGAGKNHLVKVLASEMGASLFVLPFEDLAKRKPQDVFADVRILFFHLSTALSPNEHVVIYLKDVHKVSVPSLYRVRQEILRFLDEKNPGLVPRVSLLAGTHHPWDVDLGLVCKFYTRLYLTLPNRWTLPR